MPEYQTVRPVRPLRLIEELQDGLVGLDIFHTVQVAPLPDGGAVIYYPDTVAESAVAAIVAAHDATQPSRTEQQATADTNALVAFRLGWVLGQARLTQIQNQMDDTEAATISTLAGAVVRIKTNSEAIEDLARQLQALKRTVAIQAQVEDR